MKTIFLVRHGAHAEVGSRLSGRSEIDLNDEGRAQALALASMMDGVPIASLHSSPRRRALATIAPLAARRGLDVQQSIALDEIDFGEFAGRSFAELRVDPRWTFWNARRDEARCPGGETMGEAVARALAYLTRLPDEAAPALCVTHCDIIRGILADQSGATLNALLDFQCDPGSVSTLALNGKASRICSINVQVPG